jgi:hypothetical protein
MKVITLNGESENHFFICRQCKQGGWMQFKQTCHGFEKEIKWVTCMQTCSGRKKLKLGKIFLGWFSHTLINCTITHNFWLNCEWCNVVVPSHMMLLFSLDSDLLSFCICLVYIYFLWNGRVDVLIVHEWSGTLGSWWSPFFIIPFLARQG